MSTLIPLRPRIIEGDTLTKAVDDEFERRDEFVVKDAIASAVYQKRAVTGALIITAILTVLFVLATRRRLKARLEADISAERERRAALETISVRFGVATRAARAGVYELTGDGLDLWWSDTMHELYAQPPQDFRPTMAAWLGLIHPDDRAGRADRDHEGHARAQPAALPVPHRSPGRLGVPHRIARGGFDGFGRTASPRLVGIDLDITDRVEADERERQLQQQLHDASRQAGNGGNRHQRTAQRRQRFEQRQHLGEHRHGPGQENPESAGLGKVAALLQEQAADLVGFVANDERAKHLPVYLAQLAEHLARDQEVTLKELGFIAQEHRSHQGDRVDAAELLQAGRGTREARRRQSGR